MTSPAPRILVRPEAVRSYGSQMVRLAEGAGIRLDEAQRLVSEAALGLGTDGKWAAFEVAVFAPRQNLKTMWSIARVLTGLFVLGETEIVYSAHQAKAAAKMFRTLKRVIGECPQLGGRIARVSNRLGSETIELKSGQSIECVARSTGSGRGFSGDLLIVDESHILSVAQLADAVPLLTARCNPQVVYLLSKGDETSWHLGRLRQRALSDDPGSVCWVEWSLADDDDPADRRVWWDCNPGVAAGRISMGFLEREFAALGPDMFAVEHLGRSVWPTAEDGLWGVISEDAWMACADPAAWLAESPVPVNSSLVAVSAPRWQSWPDGIPP